MSKKANLKELVDLNELQSIQDSFAKTVGTSSVIFSPEGEPITQFSNPTGFCALIQSTEEGKRRCFLSVMAMCQVSVESKEPKIRYCFAHGGHFVAPIIIDGEHKGTMFAGQFIPQKFSPEQLKALEKIAVEINVDSNLLVEEANKMRVVEEDKVWNYSSLFFQIVAVITRLGAQMDELNLAKDALQKAHDGLEIRVQERTAELARANEELKQEISERKKAEDALRESEDFKSTLLTNSPNPIIVINPDTSVRYVNHALEMLTGFSSAELIGRKAPYPWWTEETLQKTSRDFGDAQDKGAQRLEELFQRKNGARFWVDITPTPIKRDGELKYYLANWVDITERKKAEARLSESETSFRELFDNMSSGVAVYEAKEGGKDFVFKDFNQAAETIDGIKKEDLLGKSVLEVFPGVRDYGLFDVFQRVWNTGKPEHHPISFYKDKRIVGWRENYVYKLPSGEIVAVYDDVTERKQAVEALRESEEKYRTIIEQIQDVYYRADLEGNLVMASPSGARLLGYDSVDEAIGLNIARTFYAVPEEREVFLNTLKEKGKVDNYELTLKKRDGTLVPIRVCSHLCFDKDGKPLALEGTFSDITERKHAEQELEASQERLQIILEHLQTGVMIIDVETHEIFDVNSLAVEMIRAAKEEIVGKICHKFVCPAEQGKCPISDLGQSIDNSERELINANGETITILKSVVPVTLSGHQYFIECFVDISERKHAENELKKKNEELELFNRLTVDRELKMIELKKEMNALLEDLGKEPRYKIAGVGFEKNYEL